MIRTKDNRRGRVEVGEISNPPAERIGHGRRIDDAMLPNTTNYGQSASSAPLLIFVTSVRYDLIMLLLLHFLLTWESGERAGTQARVARSRCAAPTSRYDERLRGHV